MRRLPYALPHLPLHMQNLGRNVDAQRGQEAPKGALGREAQHLQNASQHGLTLEEAYMVQPPESHIDRQYDRQHELRHGQGAGLPLHRQRLFDQLLETQLLQHRGHGQQPSVWGQIPTIEVIMRGSIDFIRLPDLLATGLCGRRFEAIPFSVLHLLGGLFGV